MSIQFRKFYSGFTLIELMVVISIIAILTSIGLVNYATVQRSTRDTQRKHDLASIGLQLERFYESNNNTYPAGPADSGNTDTTSPIEWTNLLTGYMKKMPNDPGNNFYYYRRISETRYVLCATLEDSSDKDIPANQNPPKSMDTTCPSGTNYYIDNPY